MSSKLGGRNHDQHSILKQIHCQSMGLCGNLQVPESRYEAYEKFPRTTPACATVWASEATRASRSVRIEACQPRVCKARLCGARWAGLCCRRGATKSSGPRSEEH